MKSGTVRTRPSARTLLAAAGSAPGSIIAAIIETHTPAKNQSEPSWVDTPMPVIPLISRSETTQHAAASPSVAAAVADVLAVACALMRPGALLRRRVLLFELLGRAGLPVLCERRRQRIREDLLVSVLDAVEDRPRDRFRRRLWDLEAAGHICVRWAGQDRVDRYVPAGQERAQRLRQVERGRLRDRVGREERERRQGD